MNNILLYVQIGSAVLLMIFILLQQRGQGLGSSIGGGLEYSTKRGIEKSFFSATIICAIVFIGVSVARLIMGN